MAATILLDGSPLSIPQVVQVARQQQPVELAPSARAKVEHTRQFVEQLIAKHSINYGITTGFGALSKIPIPPQHLGQLQHNLVRSHSAGVGPNLPADIVRATMLLTAASLARAASGVRPIVIDTLLALLNHNIIPAVPSRGSVGASGDLAPLAHIAQTLLGEGFVLANEQSGLNQLANPNQQAALQASAEAMAQAGISPLTLEAKEGLALLNGTHLMAAMGALLVHDAWNLLHSAELAAAMSLEGAMGTHSAFDQHTHDLRPQPGQQASAAALREYLRGSRIAPSHQNDPRVQDPYSLRCIPQVLGSVRDSLEHIERIVSYELGAVTDNPLLFPDDNLVLSGGNFHGQPLATVLDLLSISVAQIAGFAERRIFLLLSAWEPEMHLTPFLTPQPGLQSGLMITQYTAAALVTEIRALAQPASVGSLPTSAGMEDWNSMGATAALQAWQALDLARSVIGIELLCASQALEQHRPLSSGVKIEQAYVRIRQVVPSLKVDRSPAPDITQLANLIYQGSLL
jgi:histidine ammonia-lyase